jgi:hypothetical protein
MKTPGRQNGYVLRIEFEDDLDFYDSVREKAQGMILSQGFMLGLGLVRVVPTLREILGDKLLILDTRNIELDEEVRETLTMAPGFDGITMFGNYGIDGVRRAATMLAGKIYFILGEPDKEFGSRFSLEEKIAFAREAERCNCRGVIVSASRPKEIGSIRKAVGNDFTILAGDSQSSQIGKGIRVGADFEIIGRNLRKAVFGPGLP